MNEKNNIKQSLLEKIKEKQSKLFECDINSEEYTYCLNELELLDLEYKELVNLKGNNYIAKITKYKELKSKYGFLENLTIEQILDIIANTKYLNKKITEGYDLETKFPELLYDFKNEILLNNIDYTKINSSETIDRILDILNEKYDNFKINLEEFYKILRNFYPSSYELLKSAVKHNNYLSINTLNELRGVGSDSLIEAIISNYENKKRIKTESFLLPSKREDMLERVDNKIKEYLNSLYRALGLFVKQNYKEYKNKIGLTIDEFKENDIVILYKNILEQASEKNILIQQTIKKFKFLRTTYLGFEMHINRNLRNIGIDIDKLKNEGIDIFTFDKEDIFEILAQLNLYNLLNLDNKKNKEESPTLLLKADEEND